MEYTEASSAAEDTDAIIVKADEVDEAGADISTISPTDESESEFNARVETRRAQDAQPSGSPKILANAAPNPPRATTRPILRREGSSPAPPQQPPPPAPINAQEDTSNATDSLSLQQLRRLVTDLPKLEPTAYAYEYSETRSFPEELEEWFSYNDLEKIMLIRAKQTFEEKWEDVQAERPNPCDNALEWTEVEPESRDRFITDALNELESEELSSRVKGLECISYIALGVWGDTAGVDEQEEGGDISVEDKEWLSSRNTKSTAQLKWIDSGTSALCAHGALQKLLNLLRRILENEQSVSPLVSSVLARPATL